MANLTAKQTAFAESIAIGKSQADAFRAAYNSKNMLSKTINEKASRIMADSRIRAKVAELRAPIALKFQMTLESHTVLEMSLKEGKNREIRRMFETVNVEIERLQRVQIGPVKLGQLPKGKWRTLTDSEIKSLLPKL